MYFVSFHRFEINTSFAPELVKNRLEQLLKKQSESEKFEITLE